MDFYKRPGIAETLDWATALLALSKDSLDEEVVNDTLGCIFKYNEDIEKMRSGELYAVMDQVAERVAFERGAAEEYPTDAGREPRPDPKQ